MQRVHIVGRKNHGKTTLVVELVEELTRRGLRVGTVKHTSHVHELDTPGKDSFLHRQAGGSPVAVVTPGLVGVYDVRPDDRPVYERLGPLYADCRLVLVEGDASATGGVKIEVWRSEMGGTPLAAERRDIAAMVTDDATDLDVPTWTRSDLGRIVAAILELTVER